MLDRGHHASSCSEAPAVQQQVNYCSGVSLRPGFQAPSLRRPSFHAAGSVQCAMLHCVLRPVTRRCISPPAEIHIYSTNAMPCSAGKTGSAAAEPEPLALLTNTKQEVPR
jgi:hypothetical protein